MIAKNDPLDNELKITITEHQLKLLIDEISIYVFDPEIQEKIANAIVKKGKCNIYFTPEELEDLIGHCCFVANHEEKNEILALELDDLIDYMEGVLEDS